MVYFHLTVMDPDDRQCLIARSAVRKKTKNDARVRVLVHPMHLPTLCCTRTTWAPCLYGLWSVAFWLKPSLLKAVWSRKVGKGHQTPRCSGLLVGFDLLCYLTLYCDNRGFEFRGESGSFLVSGFLSWNLNRCSGSLVGWTVFVISRCSVIT